MIALGAVLQRFLGIFLRFTLEVLLRILRKSLSVFAQDFPKFEFSAVFPEFDLRYFVN